MAGEASFAGLGLNPETWVTRLIEEGFRMPDWGWRLIVAAATAYFVYETIDGWRKGRISYRGLNGDRKESPGMYWFLMGSNMILIVGCLILVLEIFGEPI